MRAALTIALVALVALAACAPSRGTAYEKSLAEARAAYHNGRFDIAARKFDEASKEAKLPRDAVFMRYEAALAKARAGDVASASTGLRAIADEKPPSPYAAAALFQIATLERKTDEVAWLADLERVVTEFPDDGDAQVALGQLVRHDQEAGGPDAVTALLDRLAPRVSGKRVEEKLAYERARELDTLGKSEPARDAYLAVASKWPYPFGAFNDDALFRAAQIEAQLGHTPQAIATLEKLLSQRETSSFLGSYERPRYLPAILEVAALYEKSGDTAKARETLHRLYTDFTTSTMRDDALWREAALWKKDGKATTACDRLATLASDFPDSKYVPCATAECPSIRRAAKSKAPATCHAYVTRAPSVDEP